MLIRYLLSTAGSLVAHRCIWLLAVGTWIASGNCLPGEQIVFKGTLQGEHHIPDMQLIYSSRPETFVVPIAKLFVSCDLRNKNYWPLCPLFNSPCLLASGGVINHLLNSHLQVESPPTCRIQA